MKNKTMLRLLSSFFLVTGVEALAAMRPFSGRSSMHSNTPFSLYASMGAEFEAVDQALQGCFSVRQNFCLVKGTSLDGDSVDDVTKQYSQSWLASVHGINLERTGPSEEITATRNWGVDTKLDPIEIKGAGMDALKTALHKCHLLYQHCAFIDLVFTEGNTLTPKAPQYLRTSATARVLGFNDAK